jgi:hypothetical protein
MGDFMPTRILALRERGLIVISSSEGIMAL